MADFISSSFRSSVSLALALLALAASGEDRSSMATAPDAGPKLLSFSLDGAFYWRFEAEIEVALVATALPALFPLEDVALPGHWSLSVRSSKDGFDFSFNHGHLAKGAIGRRTRFSINLYWIDASGAEQSIMSSRLAGPTTFAPTLTKEEGRRTAATAPARRTKTSRRSVGAQMAGSLHPAATSTASSLSSSSTG